MDFALDNRWAIHVFWLLPALLALCVYGTRMRWEALRRFATAGLWPHLIPDLSPTRRWVRSVLLLVAIAALIAALIGPRWNVHYEQVQRKGIDIIFCLDVSRSMLAEDVSPNRLQRAKQYIKDVVEQLHGDRVGLVAFAGTPVLICPLTVDYGAFRMVLDDVGIQSSARGGTLIGDAVRVAVDSFADQIKKYKTIILITDGEDQESYPSEAAAKAFADRGIRVSTIGIGDLKEGSRIPITQGGQKVYLQHDGQEVWSKLDAGTLESMAISGGGAYIPAGTSWVDMGQVYAQKIATSELRELEAARIERYDAQYQWFAGLAFVLLMIEATMTDRRRRQPGAKTNVVEKAA